MIAHITSRSKTPHSSLTVTCYYVTAPVLCVRRVSFGFRRGSVSFMGKLE